MINFSGKQNFKQANALQKQAINVGQNSQCRCGSCGFCSPKMTISKKPLNSDTVTFRGPLSQDR